MEALSVCRRRPADAQTVRSEEVRNALVSTILKTEPMNISTLKICRIGVSSTAIGRGGLFFAEGRRGSVHSDYHLLVLAHKPFKSLLVEGLGRRARYELASRRRQTRLQHTAR